MNIRDIFPGRVQTAGEPSQFLPNTPCWNWLGAKNGKGYGIVNFEQKRWAVHRLSYFLRHGTTGEKRCICHTCDNPPCCNPEHLFEGTDAENALDRLKWYVQIRPEDIAEIRRSTLPEVVLARKYKMTPAQVKLLRPRGYRPRWNDARFA